MGHSAKRGHVDTVVVDVAFVSVVRAHSQDAGAHVALPLESILGVGYNVEGKCMHVRRW